MHLEPGQVTPGGTVRVDGSEFPLDDEVRIVLVGGEAAVELGTAVAGGTGSFSVVVIIPRTTPAGSYAIRVETIDDAAEMVLLVVGSPDLGGGERPGQDEGIGTLPPAAAGRQAAPTVDPPGSIRPAVSADAARRPTSAEALSLVAAAGIALIVALAFEWWRLRGRSGDPA